MKTLAFIALVGWAALTGAALHTVGTPCKTEDSTLCFWDASQHGNGLGHSFIAVTDTISIPLSK
jgi:hypothetical protein